jgi:hypothetical protein
LTLRADESPDAESQSDAKTFFQRSSFLLAAACSLSLKRSILRFVMA